MINEKNLENISNIKIKDGANITFAMIQNRIATLAEERMIPVSFKEDQISKGLFGNKTEDCLVVFHPDHEANYLYYTLRLTLQGTYAFIQHDMTGYSVNYQNIASRQLGKSVAGDIFKGRKSAAENVGAVAGLAIGGMFKLAKNAVKNSKSGGKSSVEEEDRWYMMMDDLFEDVFVA